MISQEKLLEYSLFDLSGDLLKPEGAKPFWDRALKPFIVGSRPELHSGSGPR